MNTETSYNFGSSNYKNTMSYYYNPPVDEDRHSGLKNSGTGAISLRQIPKLQIRQSRTFSGIGRTKTPRFGIYGYGNLSNDCLNCTMKNLGEMKQRKSSPKRTVPSHIVPPRSPRPISINPQTISGSYRAQYKAKQQLETQTCLKNQPDPEVSGTKVPGPELFCSTKTTPKSKEVEVQEKAKQSSCEQYYKKISEDQKRIIKTQEEVIAALENRVNELEKVIAGKNKCEQHVEAYNCACPNCGTEIKIPNLPSSTTVETSKKGRDHNNNVIQNIAENLVSEKSGSIDSKAQRTQNWIKAQQKRLNKNKSLLESTRTESGTTIGFIGKKIIRTCKTQSYRGISSMSAKDFENIYWKPKQLEGGGGDILRDLKELKVIGSAAIGFLDELRIRAKTAQTVFGKYKYDIKDDLNALDSSQKQIKEVIHSHECFIGWLTKFLEQGLNDIQRFYPANELARHDPTAKYYYETSITIDNTKRHGVFIPIPYTVDLFSSTGIQFDKEIWTKYAAEHAKRSTTPTVDAESQIDRDKWNRFLCSKVAEYKRIFHPNRSVACQCEDYLLEHLIIDRIDIEKMKMDIWCNAFKTNPQFAGVPNGFCDADYHSHNDFSGLEYHSVYPSSSDYSDSNCSISNEKLATNRSASTYTGAYTSGHFTLSPSAPRIPSPKHFKLPFSKSSAAQVTQELFCSKNKHLSSISVCEQHPILRSEEMQVQTDKPENIHEAEIIDFNQIEARASSSATNLHEKINSVKSIFTEWTHETIGSPKTGDSLHSIKIQKSKSDTMIPTIPKVVTLFHGKIEEENFLSAEVKKLSQELLPGTQGFNKSKIEIDENNHSKEESFLGADLQKLTQITDLLSEPGMIKSEIKIVSEKQMFSPIDEAKPSIFPYDFTPVKKRLSRRDIPSRNRMLTAVKPSKITFKTTRKGTSKIPKLKKSYDRSLKADHGKPKPWSLKGSRIPIPTPTPSRSPSPAPPPGTSCGKFQKSSIFLLKSIMVSEKPPEKGQQFVKPNLFSRASNCYKATAPTTSTYRSAYKARQSQGSKSQVPKPIAPVSIRFSPKPVTSRLAANFSTDPLTNFKK